MKKIIAILLAVVLLLAFCGCEKPIKEPIVGGWTEATDKTLTSELKGIFDKATEDYVGVVLEPLELAATQVVSGTNYKFICNGTITTFETFTNKYEVIVYKDTKGNISLISVDMIEE